MDRLLEQAPEEAADPDGHELAQQVQQENEQRQEERDGRVRAQIGQHDVSAIDVLGVGGHRSLATLPDALVDRPRGRNSRRPGGGTAFRRPSPSRLPAVKLGKSFSCRMSAIAQTNASRTPVATGSSTYCRVVLTAQMTINTVNKRRDQGRQALGDRGAEMPARTGRIASDFRGFCLHGESCPGKYGGDHGDSAGLFQHPGRLAARRAGCKNIIYQQDTRALHTAAASGRDPKCPANVPRPILRR